MLKTHAIYSAIQTKEDYQQQLKGLKTILDFYRFSISLSHYKHIFLGHGHADIANECMNLILGSLGLPWDWPESDCAVKLTEDERLFLASQLYQRFEKRIPSAYLTNQAYFCGLPFYVDERVLIPRSPIAELIEQQFLPWVNPDEVTHILDLCTGSACIAAALAEAFPEAQVDAIDIDKDALIVAKYNIENLNLDEQVRLIESDGFKALANEQYDIIVSNPPYVGRQEMLGLPDEYNHEPRHALEAADNGLALVDHILKHAKKHLKPHGILVVEVGNSDLAVMDTYPDLPFIWLEFERGGHGVFLLNAADL
ncbi:MAG: 50S ribosomal protein L3 N(5)-glutamine methyltransferase [Gammaproteobacteria bacterium]|nr:50S ribosomal protein L3 N(5)-glutamine methyltransferase [Gammaproteobacteria bacterium]